jgi:hypothetical protein
MLAPNLLGRCRSTGEQISSIPIATPGINQHSPLDRLTPTLKKKRINKELKRACSRWGGVF